MYIGHPDADGRSKILDIHTRQMRSQGFMPDGEWDAVRSKMASHTEGWSGAELAGLVRAATSHSLNRHLEDEAVPLSVKAVSWGERERAREGGTGGGGGGGQAWMHPTNALTDPHTPQLWPPRLRENARS